MPILEKDITIKAPVDSVFRFVDDPANLPKIWPSLYEIENVSELPNGGHTFSWFSNLAGRKVEGRTETFERVVDERIVDKTAGDVESTQTWKFRGENGYTNVVFKAEYDTPKPLPKEEMDFFVKHSELEADVVLESLKARLEL
jgi:uncharacterized membrane protein